MRSISLFFISLFLLTNLCYAANNRGRIAITLQVVKPISAQVIHSANTSATTNRNFAKAATKSHTTVLCDSANLNKSLPITINNASQNNTFFHCAELSAQFKTPSAKQVTFVLHAN